MLTPDQFEKNESLSNFSLDAIEVIIGGKCYGKHNIPVSYGQDWKARLDLSGIVPFGEANQAMSSAESNMIKLDAAGEWHNILLTECGFSSTNDATNLTAIFSRSPVIFGEESASTRFQAVLLNPPPMIGAELTLLECDEKFFTLRKSARKGSIILESNLSLERTDPPSRLSDLLNFLTFVNGAHCGLGNLFAYSESDNVAFRWLGFTKSELSKRQLNWFDIELQGELPKIYKLFKDSMAKPTTKRALIQTIEFYRAANSTREVSIEVALVASHTALEAIVNFILESCAGWNGDLLEKRDISFPDKFRAAASYFGISGDVMAFSEELKKVAKEKRQDAFQSISFFRNKIVHQDKKFTPTGLQLLEAWSLSQWFVEILIFGVIGFRGQIIDRRIYNGWRGTKCEIPLSR